MYDYVWVLSSEGDLLLPVMFHTFPTQTLIIRETGKRMDVYPLQSLNVNASRR